MKKHFLLVMLLIAAMMLVLGIESCVDDPANTDISVTTVANIEDTTTDNNPEPALPESDFGGESFMFFFFQNRRINKECCGAAVMPYRISFIDCDAVKLPEYNISDKLLQYSVRCIII